jgi:predicted phosphodiesterase
MMKIQLVSDIHLEFGQRSTLDNAGADVLVLAGDICSARNINDYMWFFQDCASKFQNVVYIMGNHEHYKHTFNDTANVIRESPLRYSNVHFLDNETITIDGVKFIGATLWTDNNKGCIVTEEKLRCGMNDFRLIKYRSHKGDYFKFTPSMSFYEHRRTIAYIGTQIVDGPCVVVTHHLPSFKSVHPKYANEQYMNGGYASDLEHMMNDNVKLWLHGHTHNPCDYMVNNTRVVCNPRGYPGERNDHKDIVLEV